MTKSTNGASRPASGRPSRTGSLVREIAKRRVKPYKTEKQRVLARKKKLDLHTSHARAPDGYQFLPVGTPDLANARPVSKFANDPEKVSYHIHRIGYHFKTEVIDEACQELGYTLHHGRFVKFDALQEQHQKSTLAATLAKFGMRPDTVKNNKKDRQREPPEEVRAAIKELFPKIPENDLHEIVTHAWEEGAERVGTNELLDLPRRVQLATIARIRHKYTDYDRLLRAFEWREARQIVEPECLQKLIEWRGEAQDDNDDEELEEIVREIIVIDDDDADDDDAGRPGSEADDEDSAELDADTSDASVEITHHVVLDDDDFGAETADERAKRYVSRLQPQRRNVELRDTIARRKINEARQRFRRPPPPITPASGTPSLPRNVMDHGDVVQVQVHPNPRGQYSEVVVIDGQEFTRLPVEPVPIEARPIANSQTGAFRQISYPYNLASQPPSSRLVGLPPQEYALPAAESIERESQLSQHYSQARDYRASLGIGSYAAAPESEAARKRRRIEPPEVAGVYDIHGHRPVSTPQTPPRRDRLSHVEVVDLTSPDPPRARQLSRLRPVEPLTNLPAMLQYYAVPAGNGGAISARPTVERSGREAAAPPTFRLVHPAAIPAPYDPSQPLLQVGDRGSYYDSPQRAWTEVQLDPSDTRPHRALEAPPEYTHPQTGEPIRIVFPPVPAPSYQVSPLYQTQTAGHAPPQPVHGAPAPVQWVLRDAAPGGRPFDDVALPPRPPPVNGAVAPTQYYHPR